MIDVPVVVNSWHEFDAKAKELVTSGHTQIIPADLPHDLKIGYLFENPNQLDGSHWVQIEIGKIGSTASLEIKEYLQSESGRISLALNWSKSPSNNKE